MAFPSPGDLPNPGIEPKSLTLQADSLPSEPLGKPGLPTLSANTFILSLSQAITFSGYLPEKAMAPHSSTLAWKIPWMEEPGRLQSMGSLRVRHN